MYACDKEVGRRRTAKDDEKDKQKGKSLSCFSRNSSLTDKDQVLKEKYSTFELPEGSSIESSKPLDSAGFRLEKLIMLSTLPME